MRRIFYLWYESRDGRYMRHSYGLHCGDALTAMIDGVWVDTRIEHSDSSTHSNGWYLFAYPNEPLENLPVAKDS